MIKTCEMMKNEYEKTVLNGTTTFELYARMENDKRR